MLSIARLPTSRGAKQMLESSFVSLCSLSLIHIDGPRDNSSVQATVLLRAASGEQMPYHARDADVGG
jgi:hypothetical protein